MSARCWRARPAPNGSRRLSAAERIADETAGYTGHDGLAGKVRDFGDKWDIARGKLEDNLTFIADYLRAVVDTFEDLDTDLAASLEQAAAGDQTAATNLNDEIGKSTAPPAPRRPRARHRARRRTPPARR
jgi:hypothetical protein